MERRRQGAGGGEGAQRSYSLCLKSDPDLLIFLHLHSPPSLVKPVLGCWWKWRAHCLLLGTLQLLRSWEADTRINSLSERLAEVSLSLAKISEKVGGSRVMGEQLLLWPKSTCQKFMRLGNLSNGPQVLGEWRVVLCYAGGESVRSLLAVKSGSHQVIARTQPFVCRHGWCSPVLPGQSQQSARSRTGAGMSQDPVRPLGS